jgi:hypothetical protein
VKKDALGAFFSVKDQDAVFGASHEAKEKGNGDKTEIKRNHPDATPQFASPNQLSRAWHFVPSTHGTNKITLRFPRRTCRYVGARLRELTDCLRPLGRLLYWCPG